LSIKTTYPKGILKPLENQNARFSFTESSSFLLHKLSGIKLERIKECQIIIRGLPYYLPWYNSKKGGGAITLGNRNWSRIIFTENFFSNDSGKYGKAAYGQNDNVWLRMASHEVVHIQHAERFKSLILYLIVFIWQYVKYGHDHSPLEKEADQCTSKYYQFNKFLNSRYNTNVSKLFSSDDTEEEKMSSIEYMWNAYNEPVL